MSKCGNIQSVTRQLKSRLNLKPFNKCGKSRSETTINTANKPKANLKDSPGNNYFQTQEVNTKTSK
jgi:hypothetical protein